MLALAVALSVGALLVGPSLAACWRAWPRALAALDVASLAMLVPVLLAWVLPHLVAEIGAGALAGVATGYVGFLVVEARAHGHAARLGLTLVVPALALHSLFDGAALAVAFSRPTADAGGPLLGGALVLHRIPEGLFLASRFGSTLDARTAFAHTAVLGAATVIGATGGQAVLAYVSGFGCDLGVAVGVGIILRMIVHRHDEHGPRRS